MKIVVLNGSPRANGNTARMVAAFKEGAEVANHEVKVIDVCKKQIAGCLACEYCHTKGNGECIQKDDMQEVAATMLDADMFVLASPIYYHNISGQLKCAVDRFYAFLYPTPAKLKSIGMILCSGASDVYEGAEYSYYEDFIGYSGLEGKGILYVAGDVSEANLKGARDFGTNL